MKPGGIRRAQQFLDLNEAWFVALSEGWPADLPQRASLDAALRHALDFGTWTSLTRQGMSDEDARDAMTSFVNVMAGEPVRSTGAASHP